MRKLAIGLIAAGTLLAAAPAMAQVVIEGPGVGLRVGPEPHYRDHTVGIAAIVTMATEATRGATATAGP